MTARWVCLKCYEKRKGKEPAVTMSCHPADAEKCVDCGMPASTGTYVHVPESRTCSCVGYPCCHVVDRYGRPGLMS
jgi:hypothetical protein